MKNELISVDKKVVSKENMSISFLLPVSVY